MVCRTWILQCMILSASQEGEGIYECLFQDFSPLCRHCYQCPCNNMQRGWAWRIRCYVQEDANASLRSRAEKCGGLQLVATLHLVFFICPSEIQEPATDLPCSGHNLQSPSSLDCRVKCYTGAYYFRHSHGRWSCWPSCIEFTLFDGIIYHIDVLTFITEGSDQQAVITPETGQWTPVLQQQYQVKLFRHAWCLDYPSQSIISTMDWICKLSCASVWNLCTQIDRHS